MNVPASLWRTEVQVMFNKLQMVKTTKGVGLEPTTRVSAGARTECYGLKGAAWMRNSK
jgi:hypothetical protein